jgi:cytochrome P450
MSSDLARPLSIDTCQYGNIFSFVLVGRKHTVCLGPEGNNFVLNGSVNEISAADIYRGLTLPIFGKDVCYDCSPAKLMEQKKVHALKIAQAGLT